MFKKDAKSVLFMSKNVLITHIRNDKIRVNYFLKG